MRIERVRQFILDVDSFLGRPRESALPPLHDIALEFAEWLLERPTPNAAGFRNSLRPRHHSPEAFLGSFMLIELLRAHPPGAVDQRHLKAELVAMLVVFTNPAVHAMHWLP